MSSKWLRLCWIVVLPLLIWRDRLPVPAALIPLRDAVGVRLSAVAMTGASRATPQFVDSLEARVEGFRDLTRKLWVELPLIERVREQSNDYHRPPQALLVGSVALARVHERMMEDKDLLSVGMRFYRDCATDSDLMTATRAVCLRYLVDWGKRANMEISLETYPNHLRNIAEFLPATRF